MLEHLSDARLLQIIEAVAAENPAYQPAATQIAASAASGDDPASGELVVEALDKALDDEGDDGFPRLGLYGLAAGGAGAVALALARLRRSSKEAEAEVDDALASSGGDISRRKMLGGLIVAMSAGAVGGPLMSARRAEALLGASAQASDTPLNVLAIVVDDLNDYVGYMGGYSGAVHTPNMDALAAASRRYMNHHVTVPICPSSRATIMWGLSARTHGLTGRHDGAAQLRDDYNVFAETHPAHLPRMLADAGVDAYGGGKLFHTSQYDNQWVDFFPTKTESLHGPNGPYETFFDFGALPPGQDHPDELLTDWTIDRLGKVTGAPFAMCPGIRLPHLAWVVPQEYIDLYPLDDIEVPTTPDDDWDDLGPIGTSVLEKFTANFGAGWYDVVDGSGRRAEHLQHYLAAMSHTDAMVGRLIEALDAQPYADETVVMLFSDNGYHQGEHFTYRKLTLTNEATRVPLLIRGPEGSGFEPGAVNEPVSSLHLLPTMLDVTGTDAPPMVEGTSLRHDTAPGGLVTSYVANSASVVTEGWRWTMHFDENDQLAEMELYDEAADPSEYDNLLADQAIPTIG